MSSNDGNHPLRSHCAHLNAFHVYAADPTRLVEANHYCAHLGDEFRQCVLYDGPGPGARLIGVEYMISPRLYATLDADERRLWHSHVFEVKAGMLVMPRPAGEEKEAWEKAERDALKEVITLYGKVYHLWQVDRGDALPLGEPQLMTSVTAHGQMDFERLVGDRDKRFGTDWRRKRAAREDMPEHEVHPDADFAWKKQMANIM